MLKLGEIIRSAKTEVRIGPWREGAVTGAAFPIAKQKRFPQTSSWSWRVVEFNALSRKFRLLIRLNTEISYYSAILALEGEQTNQIICHHEMHLSHRNWHCHMISGNVLLTHPGVLRDTQRMRIYEANPSKAGETEF